MSHEYDIVIKNGLIVDGTGQPCYTADVGIFQGKIVKIGKICPTAYDKLIDVDGKVVAPGFIDMHSHDDLVPFRDKYNLPKLRQGITTVVVGNCGISPAPVNPRTLDILRSQLGILGAEVEFTWRSYGDYLDALDSLGNIGTNIVGLVGHGALRIATMGMEARDPTPDELGEMKRLLEDAIRDGAFGMSTGLIYPPGVYSKTDELIELSKVVSKYGGLYSSHIRNEGVKVVEAVSEAIEIGRKAGVSVQISHHKASGKRARGLTKVTLKMIEEARKEGIDVSADAYPYTAGSTYLAALLPDWVHEGGEENMKRVLMDKELRIKVRNEIIKRRNWIDAGNGMEWDKILLTYSSRYEKYLGKSIKEISTIVDKDPFDLVFEILLEDGYNASMITFSMDQEDVDRVISHPEVMIGTDGLDTGKGFPHPRAYGTFPRIIRRYVAEKQMFGMEEAVRKMSGMPARKLLLKEKGFIKEGYDADIVILNPREVKDKATFENPRQYPEGIEYVIVNGVVSIENGELTGLLGGKVLRRGSA